jgi:hypothetical protein
MRTFQLLNGTQYLAQFEAEQISMDGERVLFFNRASDPGSRTLVAAVNLGPGQSVSEFKNVNESKKETA